MYALCVHKDSENIFAKVYNSCLSDNRLKRFVIVIIIITVIFTLPYFQTLLLKRIAFHNEEKQ